MKFSCTLLSRSQSFLVHALVDARTHLLTYNTVSMAETIFKMENQKPKRFMSLPPGARPQSASTKYTGKLTVPQAPALTESKRNSDVKGFQVGFVVGKSMFLGREQ